jgi:rhodanese-related sulfurtransferase
MKHLSPTEAWGLLQEQADALFIDVRMEVEASCVGRPPRAVNIAWYEYPTLKPDAKAFVANVEQRASGREQTIVLICRSGLRSVDAGIALEKAGFTAIINVLDGFEGELDDNDQRGNDGGWRFEGLPWSQS